MTSQAECERCFEAYVVRFTYSDGLVNTTLLLEGFGGKSDSVAAF